MTQEEKRILKTTIKAIIEHNSNLWWELKRQIFDMGYQPSYPVQDEYRGPIEAALTRLNPLDRAQLVAEWIRPEKASYTEGQIISTYGLMVLEEIVERARSAASRTMNW
jgi:hypothetical protein